MKLVELVSPAKSPPKKAEKKRRMDLGKKIIDLVMKADQTKAKHNKLFDLAAKAAGKSIGASPLELSRNKIMRDTRIKMVANSPLNIVKLHSIMKQMEKVLEQGR